ncbi:MAG: thiamine pyrophosphate-dependent enzyme [Sediminispirochaetaceae bacterium]
MKSTSRKHNYRKEGIKPVWCPGCGDYGVLSAVERVFQEMQLPPEYISIISGIGCSGRFSHYFNTYNLHGTHGRVLPTATGVKAAMPELTILGVSGDGDGLSIGGGHISHAARRNLDITYLILDNNIYGLTKGQTSPTTPGGFQSNTSPYGVNEEIMEPVSVSCLPGLLCGKGKQFRNTSAPAYYPRRNRAQGLFDNLHIQPLPHVSRYALEKTEGQVDSPARGFSDKREDRGHRVQFFHRPNIHRNIF